MENEWYCLLRTFLLPNVGDLKVEKTKAMTWQQQESEYGYTNKKHKKRYYIHDQLLHTGRNVIWW